MAYLFFHHPLESREGIPGRYAFPATALIANDKSVEDGVGVRACVDGFGENRAGPNIDPCPFARPLAIIHSFCRIDRRGGKYYVPGRGHILSFIVSPGDTILYGHLRTRAGHTTALFVDTVLVVASVPTLPTSSTGDGWHSIHCDLRMVRALGLGSWSWGKFAASDVWRFNLSDAAPGGSHAHTRIADHRVIIGATSQPHDAPAALVARTTSFVSLVDESSPERLGPPDLLTDSPCGLCSELAEWLAGNGRMTHGMKPPSLLPEALGRAIYDAARLSSGRGGSHAGFVAVPPLVRAS